MTHLPSGEEADVILGRGEDWYAEFDDMDPPNPIQPPAVTFTGIAYEFAGLEINSNDSFQFEFWERYDDFAGADATYSNVTLEFDDEFVPTIGPRGTAPIGTVRFDAWGTDQALGNFPNAEVVDGETVLGPEASYWGIEYGPTTLPEGAAGGIPTSPAITSVKLDTQDYSLGWFDPTAQASDAITGFFEVGASGGIDNLPTPTFDLEDPDFLGTYQTMTLDFTEGDFTEGDFLHFGAFLGLLNLADEPLSVQNGQFTGEDLVAYDPGLVIEIKFEDGSVETGMLSVAPGENYRGFLDLIATGPNFQADFTKDGMVDGDDFLAWQAGFDQFPEGGATSNDGDANGDGFVDGNDFLIWQVEFGGGGGSGALADLAAGKFDGDRVLRKAELLAMLRGLGALSSRVIPEPGTFVLAALFAAACLVKRRRR